MPATQRVDGWSVGGLRVSLYARAHSVTDDVVAIDVIAVVADVIVVVVVVVDIICRKRFDAWY